MNLNIKFDKELGKTALKKVGQYSKLIVVEGVKSVALQGVTKVVNTAFTEGPAAVKQLKFEGDIVKINNNTEKKPKKKLFSKKKETEELADEITDAEVMEKLEEAREVIEAEEE